MRFPSRWWVLSLLLVGCEALTTDPPDVPPDSIPVDSIPLDSIPIDTLPRDTISIDTIPKDTIPKDTIPRDTIPVDTIPVDTIPVDTIPADTVPVDPGPNADTLSAVTFNILHDAARALSNVPVWSQRRDLVAQAIADADADIVGLQEAYLWQVEWLTSQLPRYGHVGRGRDADGGGESVSVLFDRGRFEVEEEGHFWLSQTPDVPGSTTDEWGSAQVPRIVTWVRLGYIDGDGAVYVYNTHLPSDETGGDSSRRRGVLVLADRIAARSHSAIPFMLLGDLNSTEVEFPIRYLTGEEACTRSCTVFGRLSPVTVIDTWRAENAGEVGTHCRNVRGTAEAYGTRVDYVLVADSVRATGGTAATELLHSRAVVPDACPSDHVPVLSTFVFPRP